MTGDLVSVREDGTEVVIDPVSEVVARDAAVDLRPACAGLLYQRVGESGLPASAAARVVKALDPYKSGAAVWPDVATYGRVLEQSLQVEAELLQSLRGNFGGPVVTDNGTPRVEAGVDGSSRGRAAVQVALDRLLGVREDASDPDVAVLRAAGVKAPVWTGLREAYVQVTGDAAVSGRVNAGLSIVREANEVTTTVMNQALLNSMTKRLVQDYEGQPQDWRQFVSVRAIKDFKTQDRIRLYDFSSIPTVTEGSAYANLAWDDARETYSAVKKGSLVVVTREAILNDDIDSIRRIAPKLAIAAGITINEFVYNLITSNPTMADATKVFDDGVQTAHGNRLTSALSATALQNAATLLMKQTNSAGKRLNLRPAFLLVPPDLLFTAMTLVSSTLIPGSMNNDINVLKGMMTPIAVPQFTDVTDWYIFADPRMAEGIEIGFVGGRETPELLMQDGPAEGQVFTNDQMSYKVRWEFGGGWLDYRPAVWSQVAG